MLRFVADENVHNVIIRGLRRRQPALDLVRIQDVVGVVGAADPFVLAWAAEQDRILLTHDLATMPHFAYARVAAGQAMPGVFAINSDLSLGPIIDELLFLAEYSDPVEWVDQVWYLPLLQ